MRVLLYCYIIR